MRLYLTILFLTTASLMGTAYAEPLKEVNSEIISIFDNSATVQISWNHDESVSNYVVGCVSCIPNISENTKGDVITLEGISALEDGSIWLYIISYDQENKIINAKQVILITQ